MSNLKSNNLLSFFSAFILIFLIFAFNARASMENYCSTPPFITTSASPLVLFVMGRDHKLYSEAYNDASDIDEDGVIDIGYKNSIIYYGYFDSYKCYSYSSFSGYYPTSTTTDKYCTSGTEWSGNFLNWLSMSRMDVVRKVLMGGYRSTDTSTSTVLSGTYIPGDAHSWGKEYSFDDINKLTPFTANSGYSCTLPVEPVDFNVTGKILLALYDDSTNKNCGQAGTGTLFQRLISSFEPAKLTALRYVDSIDYHDSQSNLISSYGNYMYVTNMSVSSGVTLNFTIMSDDGSHLEINGSEVEYAYGCHGMSGDGSSGSYTFSDGTNYRVIVRLREATGDDGVILYYKKSTELATAYRVFKESNLTADGITLNAPNISTTDMNDWCRLRTSSFVSTGTPSSGGGVVEGTLRRLFCVTSDSDGAVPVIKTIGDSDERVWDWASNERLVCEDTFDGVTASEYTVKVKVCDSASGLETNCGKYTVSGVDSYKPEGLIQRHGLGTGEMVCSKDLTPYSSDCEGEEVERAKIYFGMITGSYTNNLDGGVLRKRFSSLRDEINYDGTFNISTSLTNGGIISTLSNLKLIRYNYSNNEYSDCGWISTTSLDGQTSDKCTMWGNPVGEMLYESLRYLAGASGPTSSFNYTTSDDNSVYLPKPNWGDSPYDVFPVCSRPYIIMLSDIYTSYDGDKVPNTSSDLTGFNLTDAFTAITTTENINGSYFIGDNGATDYLCTAKSLTSITNAKGLCPVEPTKKGTYTAAALAYYANTEFSSNFTSTKTKNPKLYSVAISQPIPDIIVKIGEKEVNIVPLGKSVAGAFDLNTYCNNASSGCTLAFDTNAFGLTLNNCKSTAYCPNSTIIDFYAESITSTGGTFRVNFEDMEQGADYDMDMIVEYNYTVDENAGTVTVRLETLSAAGSVEQVAGFVITGTTADGTYITVMDTEGGAATSGLGMTTVWSKTFTVSSSGSNAGFLENPLWMAAKYGGFNDYDGDGKPNLQGEWDENNDGVPDNYFYASSPLKLEEQLGKVLIDVLSETSSGTSVSILSERTRKGTILNQAVFFAEKDFGDGVVQKPVDWVGQLFAFWFYNSDTVQNIREDSESNKILDKCPASSGVTGDKILDFRVTAYGSLEIDRYYSDCSGYVDATYTKTTVNSVDKTNYLWEAGEKLKTKTAASRKIYAGNTDTLFTAANVNSFSAYLGTTGYDACLTPTGTEPTTYAGWQAKLVDYIRGVDFDGCRSRTTLAGDVYKLGDIIYSTPTIVNYGSYSMVYVGANDGMMHAFRVGKTAFDGLTQTQVSKLCNDSGDCAYDKLGQEEWGFIPKNSMPYLRYLAASEYCHVYFNDLAPYIQEVDLDGDQRTDKKILIGGMRFGGAVCGCVDDECVNPPADTCSSLTSSSCVGRSSYFALDVTDPENPVFLWEFSDPYLAYSYSGPGFVATPGTNTDLTQANGNMYHVVFTSGPTDYEGNAGQGLHVFALTLDKDFKIAKDTDGNDLITKFAPDGKTGYISDPTLSNFNKSFGGRLFTTGVDYDGNGTTDTLFFGASLFTGSVWAGNVIGVHTTSVDGSVDMSDPANWEIFKAFKSAIKPVTAKIEFMDCFGMKYILFGSGRWFYKTDTIGKNSNDWNYLYGIRIDGCLDGNCNLNEAHTASDTCSSLNAGDTTVSWGIPLAPLGGGFYMERLISDPAVAEDFNVAFFSTTQPSSDICEFGGRSRMWGLNCASGGPLDEGCVADDGAETFVPDSFTSTIYLQLSKGNIEDLTGTNFTNGVTEWMVGITPETPPVVPPGYSGARTGKILFWIER